VSTRITTGKSSRQGHAVWDLFDIAVRSSASVTKPSLRSCRRDITRLIECVFDKGGGFEIFEDNLKGWDA
jgi:hypothetical protein